MMSLTSRRMKTSRHWFPIEPVPASRPRVRTIKTKDGRTFSSTYYAGRYAQFIKDADKAIPRAEHTHQGELEVTVLCRVLKPKTTKRSNPRGDIDNYLKGVLDALTKKGYWNDDDQIVELHASKVFVVNPDSAGISLTIVELS